MAVRMMLEKVQEVRTIVVCGMEPLLGKKNVLDVQAIPAKDGKRKLTSLADEFGLQLTKRETLSCWTVEKLREDQINYCIMDVHALHVIHWNRLMRGDEKKFQAVVKKRNRFHEDERLRREEEERNYQIWRERKQRSLEDEIEDLRNELERKKRDREDMERRHYRQCVQRRKEMADLCRVHEEAEWREEIEEKNVNDYIDELEHQLDQASDVLYDL